MSGMSLIVKNITRVVAAFVVLFGIYIVLFGHLTPGGGFTGGVIIAAAGVLIVLAFGVRGLRVILSERAITTADCVAALAFAAIALIGYLAGGFFLRWLSMGEPYALLSAGTIPLSNLAIGFKVGASLYAAFELLALFRSGQDPPPEPAGDASED